MSSLECPFAMPIAASSIVTSVSVITVTWVATYQGNCTLPGKENRAAAGAAAGGRRPDSPERSNSQQMSRAISARQFDCQIIAAITTLATWVGVLSTTVFVISVIGATAQCTTVTPPRPPPTLRPELTQFPPTTTTPQLPTIQLPPPPPPPVVTTVTGLLDIFAIIGVVVLPPNPCSSLDTAPVLAGGGQCQPVLTSGSCQDGFWSIVQPDTFMSVCSPRLCDPGRVFQASDGLCHDVREPALCPGNLWPYLTGFSTVICDCDEGQYRDDTGNCANLFSQGSCPSGQSLQLAGDTEQLQCSPDMCSFMSTATDDAPTFVDIGGQCFEFGTRGPCAADHLLGYDVQLKEPVCAVLDEPFFDDQTADGGLGNAEGGLGTVRGGLDTVEGRFDTVEGGLDTAVGGLRSRRRRSNGSSRGACPSPLTAGRRRSALLGLFRSAAVVPLGRPRRQTPLRFGVIRSPLLVRCGSAARVSATFACRSIIFPGRNRMRRSGFLRPVPPNFVCPQTEATLSGDGRCLTAQQAAAAGCPPGTTLDPAGQCRPSFTALGRR